MGKRSRAALLLQEQEEASSSAQPSSSSSLVNQNNTASNSTSTDTPEQLELARKQAKKARKAEKKRLKQMNELIATQAINEAANAFESFVNGEASTDAAGVKEKKSKKDKKRKDQESDNANGEVAGDGGEGQEEPSKKKHKKSKKHANEGIEQQVDRSSPVITASAPLVPDSTTIPSNKKSKKSSSKSKSKSTPSPLAPIAPLPSTSTTTSANEFLVDPLFNFDFIPQPQPTSSSTPAQSTPADIQVGSSSSSSAANIAAHGGYGAFELPIPPASYQPNEFQPIQEDIPVDAPENLGGDQGGKKKKSKKDKSGKRREKVGEGEESEKAKRKRERREKKDQRKALAAAIAQQQIQAQPQTQIQPEEIEMQIDPALAGVGETVENQRERAKEKEKESKGKGKGKAVTFSIEGDFGSSSSSSDDEDDDSEGEVAAQLTKPSSNSSSNPSSSTSKPLKTPRRSVSVPIPPPRPILVGPIQSSDSNTPSAPLPSKQKKVFDPTDDGDVVSIEELEKDPEYVKPNQKSGTFWETLQTKWTPVKELKALAEEYGETYKQGKFSSSEDKLIKATIKNYRERSGMTSEELVTHINTRKAAKDPFASLGPDGKKLVSSSAGPLNELWLELGNALQERALLGIWNHVRRMYNPDAQKGSWSQEEDEKLRSGIKEFGSSSWEKIGTWVGRPSGDCRDRWTKQLGGGKGELLKKGKWSEEEERTLVKLHGELGNSWTAISKRMGETRTATQIRIKWNDSLSRKNATASTPDGSEEKDKSTSRKGKEKAADGEEDGEEEEQEKPESKRAWRWKTEYYSTLVHHIANLKVKNESEIDFSAIDDPTLQPQGTKNLRDRFKHLRDSAILDITERDQLGSDAKIPYQTIIEHLISLYPEPGKAYKRSYRASEKKRQLKLAEKEAKKLARQEKARKKKEGKGGSASASLPEKRKIKSTELVESSDEEEEEEGGDESSSDDSEEE